MVPRFAFASRVKNRPTFLSPTLFFYLLRRFAVALVSFAVGLLALVYLITLAEVADDLKETGASLKIIAQIVLYRLPELAEEVMPFIVLFSAMATLWRLNKSGELIVIRAAGISAWGILFPLAIGAILTGVFAFSMLNPLSAVLYSKNTDLMKTWKGGEYENTLNLSENGFWLRQFSPEDGHLLTIHAQSIDQKNFQLQGVLILEMDDTQTFTRRYDGQSGTLENGFWVLKNGVTSRPGQAPDFFERIQIPTTLTLQKIQDSFAEPKALSFWQLQSYITLLQDAGFAANKHRLQFNRQIASPALFLSMVLLAAIFSMRHHNRQGGTAKMAVSGVLTGFLLFFLSNFVIALGQSGRIPVHVAAWTPALVSMMLGLTLLLHLEDG